MVEILGNNLKKFFDTIDSNYSEADITYAGNRYEVWEVSDELFKKMCDMSEEEFVDIASEDAWWRQADGSVLGYPDDEILINGKKIKCWSKEEALYGSCYVHGHYDLKEYGSLSSYLSCEIGVSQPKNVCACAMDLAKYNDMSMGELFNKYEG